MQYKPTQIFNWQEATQEEINARVKNLSRQRIHAVIRRNYQLGNFALIERIEIALALAKAADKVSKTENAAMKAKETLALLNSVHHEVSAC